MGRLERHHFAWLSIAAAIATITLKTAAWWLTGSVGLLSDAAESLVNLAGAMFALWMILITNEPADEEHPFGHGKAEYFSAGFEGLLIFIAALTIIATAVHRLLNPVPLEAMGLGLAFSMISTLINFVVSRTLRAAAKRFNSLALEADARHLMTDVWTSVGVVGGLAVVAASGWLWLDAMIALAVGLHILSEGVHLIRSAVNGMMDSALDADTIVKIQAVLDGFASRNVAYSDLKTRRSGIESFVQLKVRVPSDWTVGRGHAVLDEIEARLKEAIPGTSVITHLEPLDERGHGKGTT